MRGVKKVKVYELMEKLSEMPSGANVRFRTLMTLQEFAECEVVDSEDGKDLYAVNRTVSEAELTCESVVTIYD